MLSVLFCGRIKLIYYKCREIEIVKRVCLYLRLITMFTVFISCSNDSPAEPELTPVPTPVVTLRPESTYQPENISVNMILANQYYFKTDHSEKSILPTELHACSEQQKTEK